MERVIAVDAQLDYIRPLLEELTDEMSIREMVYAKIEEELAAFGDHAANMRVHLSQWSRLAAEKIREIAMHVIDVISSGNWLLLRSDDAIERARAAFYVSDFDAAQDVERLDSMLNSEIKDNLQGMDALPVVKNTVTAIIKSLPEKLKSFIKSYRSVKAFSPAYEAQWVRDWRNDVLCPSSAEIDAYEDEIERVMTYDESLSRLEALQTACDFMEDAINDNEWGNLYLKNRQNLRKLLKAISRERGNGKGRELDDLRDLARKYEWLLQEIESETASCEGQGKTIAPELIAFIFDDEERAKSVDALRSCDDAKSTCKLIAKLLKMDVLKLSDVTSIVFLDSIIPYLGYDTTSSALKKAFDRDSEIA